MLTDLERRSLEDKLKKVREYHARSLEPHARDLLARQIAGIEAQLAPPASAPEPGQEPQPALVRAPKPIVPRKPREFSPLSATLFAMLLPIVTIVLVLWWLGRVPLSRGGSGFDEWTGGK